MDFSGTYDFAGSPQAVWSALHNSTALKNCIPGAEEIAWQGDAAIAVQANVGIGPINRSFTGTIPVTEQTPPSHIKVEVHRSVVDGWCTIDLTPNGAGTRLNYNATVAVSGPASAMVGMARPLVDQQINQFFTRLAQQIG